MFFIFICRKRSGPEDQIQYMISEKKDKRIQRAQVNSLFFKQLRELLGKFLRVTDVVYIYPKKKRQT